MHLEVPLNFAISYSGGKDSALALHRMIRQGHKPAALITTVNIEHNRSWFHGIQDELLQSISNSLQIPLIICKCTANDYTQLFENSLEKARLMGADSCVYGDIDIGDHREWNEERCQKAGLKCVLPLWRQDRETLVRETIASGFKALIKIVDSRKLGDSFLGQILTIPLIEEIKNAGVDVCGENGEYHTFVYDGPVFKSPVAFETGKPIDFGAHKAIEITPKLISKAGSACQSRSE